jgi:hypothetical protein
MGNASELLVYGAGNSGVAMPMDICPDRGISIEVTVPITVLQPGALSADKDEGFVILSAPVSHGSERVPEVRFVKPRKGGGVPNISHGLGFIA